MATTHTWKFFRAGGFDQVKLESGADLANLDQLDQKLWVALACPTRGLEFDNRTLDLIDTDKDGRVRAPEVIAAAKWATSLLKNTDEIKFVIGTREDYEWAKTKIVEHKLERICPLLVSWVHPLAPEQQDKSLKKVPPGQTAILRQDLAEKIIADALPVRFQIQMHKVIWPTEQRGVLEGDWGLVICKPE